MVQRALKMGGGGLVQITTPGFGGLMTGSQLTYTVCSYPLCIANMR